MKRRELLQGLAALVPASSVLGHYSAVAAPLRKKVKITDLKAMVIGRPGGNTLVRIDTDAGITGYGEAYWGFGVKAVSYTHLDVYKRQFQHRRLIPVDVLVSELAVTELYDGHQGYVDPAVCGRDARKHPGHFLGVRERKNHLVDELVRSYSPRNWGESSIRRHGRNKIRAIKPAQSGFAATSGHYGYVCLLYTSRCV